MLLFLTEAIIPTSKKIIIIIIIIITKLYYYYYCPDCEFSSQTQTIDEASPTQPSP